MASLEPGSLVGGTFRIEEALGEGGAAQVFKATDLERGRAVAVKVLREEASSDPELQARFRLEIQLMAKLDHPNIARMFEAARLEDGRLALVMELLPGEELAKRLVIGERMAPEAVAVLIRQLAGALLAAHELGIIHRDVKPENIVIVPGEHGEVVKLLDFGASRLRHSSLQLTSLGTAIGTPQYMSPEQASGARDELSAASDQFSLGVLAFELLTGHSPFTGNNDRDVMFAILQNPPLRFSDVGAPLPPAVEAVVLRALSKKPEARFPDVVSFANALAFAIINNCGQTSAEPPQFVVPRRGRARQLMLAITGVALLVIGGVGLYLALRS
jgi:eukaryotic-like serine/threonine-protein kinase